VTNSACLNMHNDWQMLWHACMLILCSSSFPAHRPCTACAVPVSKSALQYSPFSCHPCCCCCCCCPFAAAAAVLSQQQKNPSSGLSSQLLLPQAGATAQDPPLRQSLGNPAGHCCPHPVPPAPTAADSSSSSSSSSDRQLQRVFKDAAVTVGGWVRWPLKPTCHQH